MKGVLIPFLNRTGGTFLIFFLGIQGIYYGMQFNGTNHPRSPSWHLVKGLRDLITHGTFTVLIGLFLFYVVIPALLALLSDSSRAEPQSTEENPASPTPEEIETQKLQYQKQIENQEQEAKLIEEQRRIEEQKKQDVIKARRERSAQDVARDALDDFL